MGLLDTMIDEIKDHSSLILAGMALAGLGFTVYETAKGAVEAEKIREDLPDDVETLDEVKAVAPAYTKAAVAGAFTGACIIFSAKIGYDQKAELLAGYVLLDQAFLKHRGKLKELFGKEAAEKVDLELAKERAQAALHPEDSDEEEMLFYDENYLGKDGIRGRYFVDTMANVEHAEGLYMAELEKKHYVEWIMRIYLQPLTDV